MRFLVVIIAMICPFLMIGQSPAIVNQLGNNLDGQFQDYMQCKDDTKLIPDPVNSSYLRYSDLGCPDVEWDYIGSKPSISSSDIYNSSAMLSGKVINGQIVCNEKLSASIVNLTPGKTYKLNYSYFFRSRCDTLQGYYSCHDCRIIGGESIPPPGDKSGAGFLLEIPGQDYPVEEYQQYMTRSSQSFCANSEQVQIIFSIGANETVPILPGMTCDLQMLVDEIYIEEQSSPELCGPYTAPNCSSFELLKGQSYILSGWVKLTDDNDGDLLNLSTYETLNSNIKLKFTKPDNTSVMLFDINGVPIPNNQCVFKPVGTLIDGWQKFSGEFKVPSDAGTFSIALDLDNQSNYKAYYDDIRIYPINGSMKSFVYDQQTQKFIAELDENNYATFYEYDKEGNLVRTKRETEKGIYTIQESRSGKRKQ